MYESPPGGHTVTITKDKVIKNLSSPSVPQARRRVPAELLLPASLYKRAGPDMDS